MYVGCVIILSDGGKIFIALIGPRISPGMELVLKGSAVVNTYKGFFSSAKIFHRINS